MVAFPWKARCYNWWEFPTFYSRTFLTILRNLKKLLMILIMFDHLDGFKKNNHVIYGNVIPSPCTVGKWRFNPANPPNGCTCSFFGFIWWDKSTIILWRVNWWIGPLSKYHRSCWSCWLETQHPQLHPNHGLLQILISQTREWKKSICLAVVSCWHKKGWEMIGKLHRIQNPHESNQRPNDLFHWFLPKLIWRNLAVNRFILLTPADKQGQLGFPGVTQVGNLSSDENGFVIFYFFCLQKACFQLRSIGRCRKWPRHWRHDAQCERSRPVKKPTQHWNLDSWPSKAGFTKKQPSHAFPIWGIALLDTLK